MYLQVTSPVAPFHRIEGVGPEPVVDITWNPGDPNLLALVYCTGQLDVYAATSRRSCLSSAKAKCGR